MKTSELIAALSADTRPVRSGAAIGRLLVAVAAGGAAVLVLIAILIGDPFLGVRTLDPMTFGVKLGFTASLLLLSIALLYEAGRPGYDTRGRLPWLAAPAVVMVPITAIALIGTPAEARWALFFGSMWQTCLLSVTLMAVPVFALLVWAFRQLAPTDLKLAGMLGGVASGSTSALVYALHCPESSPAFLFVWFGLGIVLAGIAGRWAGPLVLRW